jgi:hypothetical protein
VHQFGLALTGLAVMLENNLAPPFVTMVLGAEWRARGGTGSRRSRCAGCH